MATDAPGIVCADLKVILEDAGICKVIRRANAQFVEISRACVAEGKTRKELASEKVDAHVGGRQLLGGAGAGKLTNEADSLFPSCIGSQACGVVQGKDLAARM